MKFGVSLLLMIGATCFAAGPTTPDCEDAASREAAVDAVPRQMVEAFRERGLRELTKSASSRGLYFRRPKKNKKPGPRVHVVKVPKAAPAILEFANLSPEDPRSQFEVARALFRVELLTRLRAKPAGIRRATIDVRPGLNRDLRLDQINALLTETYGYLSTLDPEMVSRILPKQDPGRHFKVARAILFGGPKTLAPNAVDLTNVFQASDLGARQLAGTINERYGRALEAAAWREEVVGKAPQVLLASLVVSGLASGMSYAHGLHLDAVMQIQPGDMTYGGPEAGYSVSDPGYQRVRYNFLKARKNLDRAWHERLTLKFDPWLSWGDKVKVARLHELDRKLDEARAALDEIVEKHPRILKDEEIKAEYNRR